MDYFALSAVINAVTSLILGLVVLLRNPKDRVSIHFSLFALAVAGWSIPYFFWQIADSAASALFYSRLLMSFAIFIPFVFFGFVARFLDLRARYRHLIRIGYLLAIASLAISWSAHFISGVAPRGQFTYWPVPGDLFWLFLLAWGAYVLLSEYLLLRAAFSSQLLDRRSQIFYILIGTTIGYAGGATNYFLWYGIPFAPYGNILVTIYVVFVAYAILRHRLFDIRVIATELLIFSLWLALLVRTLLEQTLQTQLLDGALLLFSVILGIALIRSVDREVTQREMIQRQEEELEVANKQQEGLLHFISHEIKGYLTKNEAAFAAIAAGDMGKVTKGLKQFSESALIDTRKGVSTVMDILDASNLKKGTVSYSKSDFDLNVALQEIVRELEPSAKEKGLVLAFSGAAGCTVNGDADKIRRHVLRNVIDNSIKYTPSGSVAVALTRAGSVARIVVTDTGVGITPEDMGRLFTEGGHGADSIKVNVHSTGYGLYIAKQVAEGNGGTIRAESEGKGKGSRFTIEFPVL
jgi:signal transduction histidine kinase